MNEAEQRIAQDLAQATRTYPDAIGIIMQHGIEWGVQMKQIQTGKFKEAMASIENSIAEVEGYLAEVPGAKNILSYTLARAYGNKGLCMIRESSQTLNQAMARVGIQWLDKAMATTDYPPEINSLREIRTKVMSGIAKYEAQLPQAKKAQPTCAAVALLSIFTLIVFMVSSL